ncbi:FprA family A-type flavoprotein [Thermovorax subterraneus]|nr:FprA family A-type flavoprotein [Thermovorax subterraneus]
MKPVEVKKGIYWVGAIDWNVRNFHGYSTHRGTTYNSYLVVDEKIALIDTVKSHFFDEMASRISQVIDPSKIDYIICNHLEIDHSGSLPRLMIVAKNAKIITSLNGEKFLKAHFGANEEWDIKAVKSGEILQLGEKSLTFIHTPMVHWPDSMVSYLQEDKILFSNDAFGQHLASYERFEDEIPLDVVLEEAAKYYANIVMPYGSNVQKAMEALSGFDVEIIAPSHGVIWRSHVERIISEYKKWSSNMTEDIAAIVYDSMWGSTEKIAYAIFKAFDKRNIPVKVFDLKTNDISDIMTYILTAKYICVGSSTLNNNMLPTVAAFLQYMKGLSPKNRKALAFGSYGWGGQSVTQVEEVLKSCGFEVLESIRVQFVPSESTIEEITEKVYQTIGNMG